ncbi:S8 family serine peptidase [Frigoribacterium sp. PhB24]|uniref:S8 family peptidase n=1 Tax=Frigoribacterium sp. PhB24 TaxID=2485204 RepID=UPI000F4879CA|nr:S8 family serine peptidase [Frigoribacterium sp. PhB24]ROS48003.1 subtilisin family serine protease [Frigoribacterium sp. PhB24]
MNKETACRAPRTATALALAGALVLAPTVAFAADGVDVAAAGPVVDGGGQGADASPSTGASTSAAATTEVQDAPFPAADAQIADGVVMNYLVNTTVTGQAAIDMAAAAVVADGGTVLSEYPEIGVLSAQSSDGGFLAAVRLATGVESAGPTRTAAVGEAETVVPASAGIQSIGGPLGGQAVAADPREVDQWDMMDIGAPEARQITSGGPSVVVGVLDTGIDVSHPDLAGQVDPDLSVGCTVNGIPDQNQSAWVPVDNGESHGTHVAGTVAAAENHVGIAGVAPGVTLASVKVASHDDRAYPEYVLCGFMWAADHGFEVTNNSYFVDPYEFWCRGEIDQAPALEAVTRAVRYSEARGVLNVAAAGNSSYDLANKTTDSSSPDDSKPIRGRDVSEGCFGLPAEIEGVVTVSALRKGADGHPVFDAGYSNYGAGVIDVGAPGSYILSTAFGGGYQVSSGTSMASPHVAGVVALLASTHRGATPDELRALLEKQTVGGGDPALYGAGVVNAFAAVTEDLGLGPIAAVADGTVRVDVPFRIRGANFGPGEVITVDGLDAGFVADENGRLDDVARVSPSLPAGATSLTLVGSEGSETTLDLLVEATAVAPVITAPVEGAVLEPGTVTVTGTAQPGAEVTVGLATADQLAHLDEPVPSSSARSARSARVVADPIAYDPEAGNVMAVVQADVSGQFSVPVAGVPVGAFGVVAVQTLTDRTMSFSSPVFFSVVEVVPPEVVPPVVAPVVPPDVVPPVVMPVSSGLVPVSTARATRVLAYTGSEPAPFVATAVLMVLAGVATVMAKRHRRRSASAPRGD